MAEKSPGTDVRVLMAKSVAQRWITERLSTEYRFSVYGFEDRRDLRIRFAALKSWREGRRIIPHLSHIPDLGLQDHPDRIEFWSSDLVAARKLAQWFEKNGFDTTFIW